MDFKSRILEALREGRDDPYLLKIVRDCQTSSFTKKDVYDVLQEIWQEMEFDGRSDGGALQDRLEFVMEKTWYESPVGELPR